LGIEFVEKIAAPIEKRLYNEALPTAKSDPSNCYPFGQKRKGQPSESTGSGSSRVSGHSPPTDFLVRHCRRLRPSVLFLGDAYELCPCGRNVRESPFASAQAAAVADAPNLSPAPTVSTTSGTDSAGRPYVEVTAAYTFRTITGFPGVPNQVNLTRKVRMNVSASSPN